VRWRRQPLVWATGGPAGADELAFTSPGTHSFQVPEGVTQLGVLACGAEGGVGVSFTPGEATAEQRAPADGGLGGQGARVEGILSVTPGESLRITVGGAGGDGQEIINDFSAGGPGNALAGLETAVGGAGGAVAGDDGGGDGGGSELGGGGGGGGGAEQINTGGGGGGGSSVAPAGGTVEDGACTGDGFVVIAFSPPPPAAAAGAPAPPPPAAVAIVVTRPALTG
jgi:hypothetical protein